MKMFIIALVVILIGHVSISEAGTIKGTVTNSIGEALSNIKIVSYYFSGLGHYGNWVLDMSTYTDANGNYAISTHRNAYHSIRFIDESGNYIVEYYDDVTERDYSESIYVAVDSTVSNINAELEYKIPTPPADIVGVNSSSGHCYEVKFTGKNGRSYRVQESSSLSDKWKYVSSPLPCESGTNVVELSCEDSAVFWRLIGP